MNTYDHQGWPGNPWQNICLKQMIRRCSVGVQIITTTALLSLSYYNFRSDFIANLMINEIIISSEIHHSSKIGNIVRKWNRIRFGATHRCYKSLISFFLNWISILGMFVCANQRKTSTRITLHTTWTFK